jgi:ferrochelatase
MSARTGLLLINLGTPDAPQTGPVRRYLRQFLSDPRVLDISPAGRWALLNLVILPFRPARSAEAYRKVWMPEGSPLLFHSLALRDRMRERLGDSWQVELGMRYGSPSIESALTTLAKSGAERIVVAALFPQYSSAANGSAIEETFRVASKLWNVPSLNVLPEFYDDRGFIEAFAQSGRAQVDTFKPDHVLFSFHGLPERQVKKSDEAGTHCLKTPSCCDSIVSANRHCYRAQSFATARLIAEELNLPASQWSVSFQSRLGRTPWIRPHTDVVLPELAKRGIRRVLVYSPAFVADCLETLEEIQIRAREQFRSEGGEDLQLVPSLNSSAPWVEALTSLVERAGSNRRLLPVVASAARG